MKTITLSEKQTNELATLENKFKLESLFNDLTGFAPSIISPNSNPFAVFTPKTKDEYLHLLNILQPTEENAKVTFAGKAHIDTFSPYLITYGGLHDTPSYMNACIKFEHSICPIWIKLTGDLFKEKFSISTKQGDHKGFGRYETKYTSVANKKTTVQDYYGNNKTMYAATQEQANELKEIIFS